MKILLADRWPLSPPFRALKTVWINAFWEIFIENDATDDPTHGRQQLSMFHGFYGHFMYSELFFHDGGTGQIVVPVLRPGNSHSNRWYAGILRRVVRAIRTRYPDMVITIRGDSGFSCPGFYELAAEYDLYFVLDWVWPRAAQTGHPGDNAKGSPHLADQNHTNPAAESRCHDPNHQKADLLSPVEGLCAQAAVSRTHRTVKPGQIPDDLIPQGEGVSGRQKSRSIGAKKRVFTWNGAPKQVLKYPPFKKFPRQWKKSVTKSHQIRQS